MKTGIELIRDERARQISKEGWTAKHDAEHEDYELTLAALSYASAAASPDESGDEKGNPRPLWDWPFDLSWWKPSTDPVRNLVKAGALIAAEIDRLQRANSK